MQDRADFLDGKDDKSADIMPIEIASEGQRVTAKP
jgi:hypothetical protein